MAGNRGIAGADIPLLKLLSLSSAALPLISYSDLCKTRGISTIEPSRSLQIGIVRPEWHAVLVSKVFRCGTQELALCSSNYLGI